jgi:hypothetical protein
MKYAVIFTFLFVTFSLGIAEQSWSQNWTGAGDGLTWHDDANWDTGVFPTTFAEQGTITGASSSQFDVEINQVLNINRIFASETILSINAETAGGIFIDSNSTININSDLTQGGILATDSTVNFNSGTLNGALFLTNSQFNRTGGVLQSSTIRVSGNTTHELTIASSDSVGNVFLENDSVLTMNGGTAGWIDLDDGTFDWNGGTFFGLRLNANDVAFNRNGNSLDSVRLVLRDHNFTLLSGESIDDVYTDTNELSINGATVKAINSFNAATINFNDGAVLESTQIDDSVFNWNGGSFSGSLELRNLGRDGGFEAEFNRNTSDPLNVTELELWNIDTFSLTNGDSVSGRTTLMNSELNAVGASLGTLSLSDNSILNLNGESLGDFHGLSNSTLNLNSGSVTGNSLSLVDGSIINRTSGANLDIETIYAQSDMQFITGDLVDNLYVGAFNDASISASVDIVSSMDIDNLYVFQGSEVTIVDDTGGPPSAPSNGNGNVSFVQLLNGSKLNMFAGDVTGAQILGGEFNWNGGSFAGNVQIGDSTDGTSIGLFNRNVSSDVTFGFLRVEGHAQFQVLDGDEVENGIMIKDSGTIDLVGNLATTSLEIEDSGVFNIFQIDGQTDGLALDSFDLLSDSALLHISFDGVQNVGVFDWGLQINGDQIDKLSGLIDGGQITFSGNSSPVGVFFDAGSDTTSVGFLSAVPEPNSLIILSVFAAGLFVQRRR